MGEVSNARQHCTHWFDLAGLAVAHAAAARASREYRCAVWGAPGEVTTATLERDGEPLLVWRLEGMTIHGAAPFEGRSLKGAFQSWAEAELDPDLAEAAIVLRRAAYISPVRFYDLDQYERPGDVTPIAGQCFTYTEGTAQRARAPARLEARLHAPARGAARRGPDRARPCVGRRSWSCSGSCTRGCTGSAAGACSASWSG